MEGLKKAKVSKRKAVYRKGLGSTLISGISEEDLRKQKMNVINRLLPSQDTIDFPQGNRITGPSALNV